MATNTQDNRPISVTSVLGKDVLLLQSFIGREAISRLFSYQLELLSENDSIAAKDLVGTSITWAVHEVDKSPRYFNGMVSRMSAGHMSARNLRAYRVEVVPKLWFLTRTANCKIFQNKTTPDIIQSILGDFGISDFAPKLRGKYNPREYCVQYRETAFNFIARLMEQDGIFYFFQHNDGKHTLVLADAKGAFQDCVENSVRFSGGTLATNHVTSWERQYEYRSGKWTATDYNFETPSTSLLSSTATILPLANIASYEFFDYPGNYMKTADGTAEVKIRMEEEEASFDVVAGSSQCCTFTPGGKFQLEDHDISSETGKYVITSIIHSATEASYGNSAWGTDYSNTFTCIPDSVAYRPTRLAPKPSVQGTQTAVVVGPKGEEIYTDKYGRIKVQFHWDRLGKRDENSSCWIRVATLWAGKSWGVNHIPRIGQEVVVDFLEGDPDRPLVIGSVYNVQYMPANDLPAKKNVSGFKSNSTKGGGGYNEISLDDTKGKEQVIIHGQHDMHTTVEHDQTTHVKQNRSASIDVDDSETVGGNQSLSVKKKQTLTVEGQRDVWVKKDQREQIDGKHSITCKGDRDEQITGTVSIDAKGIQANLGGPFNVEAAQEVHIKGQSVIIEAGTALTIKVGGSFVKIDAGGVTVVGAPLVKINSGGAAGQGAAVQVSPPDPPDAAKSPPPDGGA